MLIPISQRCEDIYFDHLTLFPMGLLRVEGWTESSSIDFDEVKNSMHVFIEDQRVPLNSTYRTFRPDIAEAYKLKNQFHGIVFEYIIHGTTSDNFSFKVIFKGNTIAHSNCQLSIRSPAYSGLLKEDKVLKRENIYTSGPPAKELSSIIVALADKLESPVLDFGCGAGILLKGLRRKGIEAIGIELNRSDIVQNMEDCVKPFVTLYDGRFPSPYPDDFFAGVICVEVIEHIPDYELAIQDIKRITKKMAILTVPDCSAIPILYPHYAVPWHCLEGSHVNFFNQKSFEKILKEYFSSVEIIKIHPFYVNESSFFMNLVAICTK